MNAQIPLLFPIREDKTFATYLPGPNQQTLSILQTTDEPLIYLWGEPGCGKTHLLQACCSKATERQQTAVYLPLTEIQHHVESCFEGLEQTQIICLDDLESMQGVETAELALFHLFNRLRDADRQLVVSATTAPAALSFDLADLNSRMHWGVTLQIQPLNDDDMMQALMVRADQLGMQLEPKVAQYLLTRAPRDAKSLWQLMQRLDQASLAEQRKLSIPFVRNLLNDPKG